MQINGVAYHVVETGESSPNKPTLVFLHGFTGSSKTYAAWMLAWSEAYHCLSFDMIGHGKTDSPATSSRYHMENVIADIWQILQEKAIRQVVLIGYSMGGRVAISFASRFPEMVNGLVLMGSSPGLPTAEEREQRRASDEKLAAWIKTAGIEEFVDYWQELPLFDSQKQLTVEKQKAVRSERLKQQPLGLANSLIGMGTGAQESYWEKLHRFTFPVLLITGEYDQKFQQIAANMHTLLPISEIAIIERAGHAAYLEQPEVVQWTINNWLMNQIGGKLS